ncbi:MAG: serine/threonine protein kinase [Candidatus Thorarchaeota archaeon]|nr:MAG: serine/threonine protein kinase [Candidatus Thorarchaeota archaeon]
MQGLKLKSIDTKYKQIESDIERRRTKRRKDDDEFKVVEGVIDPPTLKAVYKLLSRGTLRALHGAISTGKEASVYRGEDRDGRSLAVKIYRVTTAESDFMLDYIVGDPRFKNVRRRHRSLIPMWALKEYKNLQRYDEAGVRVPKPIDIQRNVLVMEFIGDAQAGVAAPLLKNVTVVSPVDTYDEIIEMIETGYKKAGLVHADLSEYNILWHNGPVIIDVSQAVLTSHPNAQRYLYRDLQNITNFFKKIGIEPEDPQVIMKDILSAGGQHNGVS